MIGTYFHFIQISSEILRFDLQVTRNSSNDLLCSSIWTELFQFISQVTQGRAADGLVLG